MGNFADWSSSHQNSDIAGNAADRSSEQPNKSEKKHSRRS